MVVTQEFLVLSSNGTVRVFGVDQFPEGTHVAQDARRLRVVGPVWIKPRHPEMTAPPMRRLAGTTPLGWVLRRRGALLVFRPNRELSPVGDCRG
jgi:hypothetical protein